MQPVGKYLLGMDPVKQTPSEHKASLATLCKFQESAWKCVAYTSLSMVAFSALKNETFWWDTAELWTECSGIPCEYEPSRMMTMSFVADMAYYTYAIPYCIVLETKRKDFWATFVHHIITVILIGYAYSLGFTKAGLVVIALHDVCDPFLEFAKMTKYANMELLTNVFFVIFTFVWIAMRVLYFPLWIIRSILFDAYAAVVQGNTPPDFPHWGMFSGMLISLWLLHVFWTYVILKIAVEAVASGAADDHREKEREHLE
jgi:hypothetical protein